MNRKQELDKKRSDELLVARKLIGKQNELLGQALFNLEKFLYLHKCISLLDLEEIFNTLKEKLPYILNVRHFSIFLYNPNKKILTLVCHTHPKMKNGMQIPLQDSGAMKDVLTFGRYILEKDFSTSKYFHGIKNPLFDDAFFVSVPLMIENNILGVINLNDSPTGVFSSADLDHALNVTEFISLSVSNALFHEKTEALSVTDGLTGLNNHLQMQKILSNEFHRSLRYKSPLSYVMIDVDHFKKINDNHGHQMGDSILVELAEVLDRACRKNDSAARYGGEEFAMILPETHLAGATMIAERIRKEVETIEFKDEGKTFCITVSCGVATLAQESMQAPEALVESADRALYQAKKNGRNQTVVEDRGKANAH